MADDDLIASCGCKGIRTCLICEKQGKYSNQQHSATGNVQAYFFCSRCNVCYRYTDSSKATQPEANCKDHAINSSLQVKGIKVIDNFLSLQEETELIHHIDLSSWAISQSGRKKQDFGPQVNFKRKKLKMNNFKGLPNYCRNVISKMHINDACNQILANFRPVELCNLDYSPDRGSAIDPHFDDFWLWGDRLVTINLLSGTILTLSKDDVEVDIPMPPRSLVIIFDDARTLWKHGIKRQNITSRRVCMTFRELSDPFLSGGEDEDLGKKLLDIAMS